MDKDTLRGILILSLDSVENPTFASSYRKICRMYSREFSTPLHEVMEMPEEVILRTYYEDQIQAMADAVDGSDEAKRMYDEMRQKILENTLEEDDEQELVESEEDWMRELNEKVAAENKKEPQAKSPNLLDKELNNASSIVDQEMEDIVIKGEDQYDYSYDGSDYDPEDQ